MGGAFIAVADDVNTLYWNPAGVATAREGIIYFITLTSPDQMGYRHFIGVNKKLDGQGIGFSYIQRIRPWDKAEENWYVVSFGTEIIEGISFGLNYRYKEDKQGGSYNQQDLGFLWRINDNISAGALYQSLNNLRLGISYSNADEGILLSADVYDALDYRRYMIGAEYSLDEWAIRTGLYNKDPTIGIGYNFKRFSFDIAVMFRNTNIVKTSFTYEF